jgi:hypothetical protein
MIFETVMTWLAAYGMAFICAFTHGPFRLCGKFREMVLARFKQDWIQTGIECPVCVGFWVSIIPAYWFETGVNGWWTAVGFICVVTVLSPEIKD